MSFKRSSKRGKPFRIAWVTLLSILVVCLAVRIFFERPRFQYPASPISLQTQNEATSPHAFPRYGLPFYQQKPIVAQGKPFVFLVIQGMENNPQLAETVLQDFPKETTLVFSASPAGPAAMEKAYEKGHELLLQLPAQALENKSEALLQGGKNYIGVMVKEDAGVVADKKVLAPFLEMLKEQNLAFMDVGLSAEGLDKDLPWVKADIVLAPTMTSAVLAEELEKAHKIATEKKAVVIVAPLTQAALEALQLWLLSKDNLYALAPLSQSLTLAKELP